MNNLQIFINTNYKPLIICVIIVLVGYFELFLGSNLWLYPDQLINSFYSYGYLNGNGWISNKAFGGSYFFTDTGRHPWSPIVLFEKFIQSRTISYNSVVIFQSILSSIAMYFLLKRVTPKLNVIVCALIAPLVVFTIDIDSSYYESKTSASLVAVPLMLICIYDYYKKPAFIFFIFLGLIFFYNIVFGYFLTWSVLPSICFVFTILYILYYKKHLLKYYILPRLIYYNLFYLILLYNLYLLYYF